MSDSVKAVLAVGVCTLLVWGWLDVMVNGLGCGLFGWLVMISMAGLLIYAVAEHSRGK